MKRTAKRSRAADTANAVDGSSLYLPRAADAGHAAGAVQTCPIGGPCMPHGDGDAGFVVRST